jgi:hypothetical protein
MEKNLDPRSGWNTAHSFCESLEKVLWIKIENTKFFDADPG